MVTVGAITLLALSWEPMPTWLGNPASAGMHSVHLEKGILRFTVNERARGMKWRAMMPSDMLIELSLTPFLVVEYRARGIMVQREDYTIWLSSGREGKSVLPLRNVVADGRWHLIAIDCQQFGIVGCATEIAIQVQAADARATLEFRRLEFASTPPERATVIPPPSKAPPWSLEFDDAIGWHARPKWLGNPTVRPKLSVRNGIMRLEVPEAGRGMKWSLQFKERLDLSKYRYLIVRYRARGLHPHTDYFIYFGSGVGGLPPQFAIPIRVRDLDDDGEWHVDVVRITESFRTAEIALQVQADEPNAFVEIDYIRLVAARPKISLRDMLPYERGWVKPSRRFEPLKLPHGNTHARDLLPMVGDWFDAHRITVHGIPFEIAVDDSLLSTSIAKCESIAIPINGIASEAYIILVALLPAMDVHHAMRNAIPMREVKLVERFVVAWEYTDGVVDEVFPLRIPARKYSIVRGIGVYALPIARKVPLRKLVIYDRMRIGAFAIVAVTLNRGARRYPLDADLHVPPMAVESEMDDSKRRGQTHNIGTAPRNWLLPKGTLAASARKIAIAFTPSDATTFAIKSPYLPNLRIGRRQIFEVTADGKALAIRRCIEAKRINGGFQVRYELDGDVKVTLRFVASENGELRCGLSAQNAASKAHKLAVTFPILSDIALGAPNDDWYFVPRKSVVLSDARWSHAYTYCGADMPLQFVALFDASGCIYLRGLARGAIYRRFTVGKDDAGTSFSVKHYEEVVNVGASFEVPEYALGAGAGDWHIAFDVHRKWLKQALPKPLVPRKDWFRRIFCFRQNFLHAGLFDRASGRYNIEQFVEDDRRGFGVCEYYHLFDWAASAKFGRVGDYDHYDEIGGLNAFRDAIRRLQKLGVRVGLYFEGYLVDSRSNAGKVHLEEWALRDGSGKMRLWPSSLTEHFVCPWCASWQDYLRRTYARVASETGADGFYIDEFGFGDRWRFCYSDRHGHAVPYPVLGGELIAVRKVRGALPHDRVLYTEEAPIEMMIPLQDGAFTYAISSWWRERSPVPVAIVRFAFPNFKTFEILSFQPYQRATVWSLAKFAFFNGEAIWIQHPPRAFAPEALKLVRRIFAVLKAHADAFAGDDAIPLTPTLIAGVYANEFIGKNKRVFTFFNSLYRTVRGEVIRIRHRDGAHYADAWNRTPISTRIANGWTYIQLELPPRGIGCIVQEW